MGVLNQIGTIQPGMIADMDIIHGNPLQNIETIGNDAYVMQNGRLFTESQLIGPYANVQQNTPPTSDGQVSIALAEAATLSRGKHPWATVGEVAKLQQPEYLPVPPGERKRSTGGQRRRRSGHSGST